MPTIAAHELTIDQLKNLGILKDPAYNGFDNCITFQVDEARQRLGRNDTLIYDFEIAMQAAALEMMLRGFLVDKFSREDAIVLTTNKKDQVERIIKALVTAVQGTYNAKLTGSPKQLINLFYNLMKLDPITKTVNGELKYPMDRETLEKIEAKGEDQDSRTNYKFARPIIKSILFFRDLRKTLQVLETEIDNDWRWRCSYNIGGTTTGRWSSSKSPFGTGSNFQNINEELRRIFIPDPGYKLYGIDKSQSEARDVGWFCGTTLGDWTYLDACESGDLHTAVTRLLYPEKSWSGDLKKDKSIAQQRFYRKFTYRDASKRLAHASNYFGKPKEISRQTRIPLPLVESFQQRYFSAFPCIAKMHQWIIQHVQRHRYLVNSFGRRRDFFDRPESYETIKSAIAYMFQSATGDCLNLGLWRLQKHMHQRIQILSQLHDAVYFQAKIPDSDADEQALLRDCLNLVQVTQTDPRSGRRMTIPAEVSGGFNWAHRFRLDESGNLEDWNPRGLVEIRVN